MQAGNSLVFGQTQVHGGGHPELKQFGRSLYRCHPEVETNRPDSMGSDTALRDSTHSRDPPFRNRVAMPRFHARIATCPRCRKTGRRRGRGRRQADTAR